MVLLASVAGAQQPLEYQVRAGDTISKILWQHVDEVQQQVANVEAVRGLTPLRMVYKLIANSPWVSSATIRPGDLLRVGTDGRLNLIAGSGVNSEPGPAAEPVPRRVGFTVAKDGRSVRIDYQIFRAGPGLRFVGANETLYVLGQPPGRAFELAVVPRASGGFSFPDNPYFVLAPGDALLLAGVPTTPDPLFEGGQVRLVAGKLRLTSKLQVDQWQQLYQARADESPYSPVRRRVASAVLIHLLERKIPPEETAFPLAWAQLLADIGKGYRAFEQGVSAKQIFDLLDHPFEISADRRALYVAGQTFVAGETLSFEYCGGHFHVVGRDPNRFSLPVDLPEPNESFAFPPNPFCQVVGNVLVAKPPSSLWQELINTNQIELKSGHYHLTLAYHNPDLARLKAVMDAPGNRQVADKARELLFDILRLTIVPRNEDGLRQALGELDKMIAERYQQLEAFAHEQGATPPQPPAPSP